jgi:tetratricopeptide (TPR) repeat protein
MKKNRIRIKQKKHVEETSKIDLRFVIVLFSLAPVFFSALFQGGYFPWETYLTFLLALPAIFLFLFMKINFPEGLRKSVADRGLFIFLLVTFVSLFFTVYFHTTLTEFFKVLVYLSLFYIILNCVESEKDIGLILNSILSLSFVLSLLGILASIGQRLNLSGPFFDFLSRNGLTQAGRIASTLQYSNTFAAFIILPFFISFSYFIMQKNLLKKILYLTLSLTFLITFALTESRGALIAFVIAILIYILFLKGKDKKFSLISFAILIGAIFIVVIIKKDVFLPIFKSFAVRLKELLSFFQGKWEESLGDRVIMVKDSFHILKDKLVLGTGNGTYQYVYAKYRTIYFFSKFPHSIFFQILDELGILGGAAFVYMIFSLFKKGFQVVRTNYTAISVGLYAGLAGLFLHTLVDFDWSLMFMPLIFFYLFAVLLSSGKKEYFVLKCPIVEKMRSKKQPVKELKTLDTGKILTKRIKVLGIISASVLLIVFLFQFLGAYFDFRASATIGKLQWPETVSMYKIAVALDPLASEYHYNLANFNFTYLVPSAPDPTQYVEEAVSHYEAAIKHCPEFFLYHFEFGKLYLQTSNKKAMDEFIRTVQLNPLDSGAHATLGFAYLKLKKDMSMAKIQLEEALRLDAKNPDAYLGFGSLYEEQGEPDKALENYQLAVKYDAKNAYAYYRSGVIYENKGMLPEAVNNLFWAVKYNPNLTEAKTEFEKYAPIITIAKPENGETIKVGTTYEINWLPSNDKNLESFAIYLIPPQGDWILLDGNISSKSFNYTWQVPETLSPGTYTIRIYAVTPNFMQGKFGNWLSYEEVQINLTK